MLLRVSVTTMSMAAAADGTQVDAPAHACVPFRIRQQAESLGGDG
jgi:hypothetical protein